MKSMTATCNTNHIEAFLAGKLDSANESALTKHIDQCTDCRSKMESLAAEPESWHEAHTFLQPTEFHAAHLSLETPTRSPLQVRSVLDSLAPTDDPEMLGRLGTYEVSGVVGVGGMGIVLKAMDRSLDRTVAIKVLAPHLATSGAARKRFAREAKATAAVLHPNVIAIHGVSNNDSLPWLVMPYVRGLSLQKRIDQEGALPVGEILRIGSQIAAGLSAAHAQGLVHRDIKPANVLLEEGVERVTITDFGLARAVDDATMTRSGIVAGTPQYMSPEQARGEAVDGRSDLFSLGSVLYAMCTGRSPFRAETTYGVMRRITDDPARPIQETNPNIPNWLCHIIDKLMSKQADQRFQSSAEVAELLEECLAHIQQPTQIPLPARCKKLQAAARSPQTQSAGKPPANRGLVAVLSAAVFGLMGALAVLLWQASDPPQISGTWNGPEWGTVTLAETGAGQYQGTYTDVSNDQPGTITLKWSRLEKRFNGKWRNGDLRFGKISVRLVDGEIRGAWTTSKKSKLNSSNPRLADLVWTRGQRASADLTATNDLIESSDQDQQTNKSKMIPAGFKVIALRVDGINIFGGKEDSLAYGQRVNVRGIDDSRKTFNLNNVQVFSFDDLGNRMVVGLMLTEDQAETLERRTFDNLTLTVVKSPNSTREARESRSPEGMKTVKLSLAEGSDLIQPGDLVDVLTIHANGEDSSRLLTQVQVVSIQKSGKGQSTQLLLTAQDAETLRRESRLGTKFRLALLADTNPGESDESEFSNTSDFDSLPFGAELSTPEFEAGMSLADAVQRFNDYYAEHPLAKGRNPLTVDEVVSSMRWAARYRDSKLKRMSDEIFEEFCSIYENQILPKYWSFEILTDFGGLRQEKFKAWTIRIAVKKPSPSANAFGFAKNFTFGIRDQTLCEIGSDTILPQDEAPEVDKDSLSPDAMPLQAAINELNDQGLQLAGVTMEPLTIAEVLASIKRAHRDEMPLTNSEYAEFLAIAESPYQLPEGYKLEKLTSFGDADGGKFRIWSIRLVIPRSSPGKTYAHIIRNQFVDYQESDLAEVSDSDSDDN